MADRTWRCKSNLTITTPRLLLRDYDPDNALCVAAAFRLKTDPRSLEFLPGVPPKSIEEARKWLQTRLATPNSFNFTVELRFPPSESLRNTSANIIGMVGGCRTPEFGYQFDSNFWGHGFATEAMAAVLDAYWDTWPAGMQSLPEDQRNKVVLKIEQNHQASQAVARKLNFVKVGEAIEETDKVDESINPVILNIYELKRPPQAARSTSRAYERIESNGTNFCDCPLGLQE